MKFEHAISRLVLTFQNVQSLHEHRVFIALGTTRICGSLMPACQLKMHVPEQLPSGCLLKSTLHSMLHHYTLVLPQLPQEVIELCGFNYPSSRVVLSCQNVSNTTRLAINKVSKDSATRIAPGVRS